MYIHIFIINSSINEQLGCFHILATINNDAMNIGRHISFQIIVFSFFRLISRIRIVGPYSSVQFSCSVMYDPATPWTAARQASLSITNSRSLAKLMSIESVMPSNHLILCRPLLLPPSIFPSIRVFSNESALCIRWSKYWFQLQHQSFQ